MTISCSMLPQVEFRRGPAFFGAALAIEQHPHDILDVNVSEHVFARAFKHGQPRTLRGDEHAHHVVQRGVGGHRMHVGPRHHQFAHLHAIEFNRAEDEFLFLHADKTAFARLLDLNLQFFRGVHLRVALRPENPSPLRIQRLAPSSRLIAGRNTPRYH